VQERADMTQPEGPPGTVADRAELPIETRLAALERQMQSERLYLSLAPDALDALRTELAAIEQKLDQTFTYLFPWTRRRLKAQASDLHRRIALQAIELEDVQERHFHPVVGKH